MKQPVFTHARLLEVLDFDPESGAFTWLEQLSTRGKVGARAGYVDPRGTRTIRIDGEGWQSTRLAWFYVHGVMPEGYVIPMDCDPDNTRMSNLRLGSKADSIAHAARHHRNLAQAKGVSPSGNRFAVRVQKAGKTFCVGSYKTAEQASAAYLGAARVLYGEFARAG